MAILPVAEDGGPYWAGDTPAALVVMLEDEMGGPLDPTGATATAFLYAPETLTEAVELEVSVLPPTPGTDDAEAFPGGLSVAWPAESPFLVEGFYTLRLRLTLGGTDAARIWLEPIFLPVMDFTGWLTLEAARRDWSDAPMNDSTLFGILFSAKRECISFAPAIPVGSAPPVNYVQAQLMQAQATWTVTQTDPQSQIGAEGFSVRVFPLDWNIKQKLRPKRGVTGLR